MAFGSFDNKSGGHTVSEINMVPLIDVMLVLLVIFIITAPLLSHSLQIDLPQASGDPVQQEPEVIDLAIDDAGAIFWNEEPVSQDRMAVLLREAAAVDPQPVVRVRAHLDTRYDTLADVMSAARQAGLKRLGFVTRPDAPVPGAGTAPSGTQIPPDAAGAATDISSPSGL